MSNREASERAPAREKFDLEKLGHYLDGWADLVDNMGSKANDVRRDVLRQLKAREMPDIETRDKISQLGVLGERRTYVTSSTHPGATTTIYVAEHGRDLYVAWRTYVKVQVNGPLVLVAFCIALILAALAFGETSNYDQYGHYVTEFSALGVVFGTILFLLVEAGLVALAGHLFKGSIWGFVFFKPNRFDLEDITAMSLSVHKTIISALDRAGIDISKLRLKQTFKGGEKEIEV